MSEWGMSVPRHSHTFLSWQTSLTLQLTLIEPEEIHHKASEASLCVSVYFEKKSDVYLLGFNIPLLRNDEKRGINMVCVRTRFLCVCACVCVWELFTEK